MPIQSINPATGEVLKTFEPFDDLQIEVAINQSRRSYTAWRGQILPDRMSLVEKFADTLEKQKTIIARLMVLEMGKTLTAAEAELDKCVQYCRYSADKAPEYLADDVLDTEYKRALTSPLPLGPVLLIMPWNFPFWQVIRVAIPALLAGNTILLKHASNVPQCAIKLEELFKDSGFEQGCFLSLQIESQQVEPLLADPRIKAVSLTGSEAAGSAVAAKCGEQIKKTVLELGGSDPFIVMPSADIDAAVEAAIISRTRNNGQSCIAAKRIIVHEHIYDEFRAKYLKELHKLNIGDPLNPDTDLGPLVSDQALKDAQLMIKNAVSQGAEFTESIQTIPEQGFYIVPGILENIDPGMWVYDKEIFAPVAMFCKVAGIDTAIDLANDTPFGLSSVLFSHDPTEIDLCVGKIEAGSTFVNRYASSDIRLPFGGVKRSGYGREMAKAGMLEFTNLKTVIVAN
ncbi:MAG: NAD-dependent succinate-semialdehyde dehydrogenase [Acidimicrobiales bacterium]|nr:MAG: NAD-dependent succinate-semialdehyde dehydrogenase [Acidimicrobiales bacterium]